MSAFDLLGSGVVIGWLALPVLLKVANARTERDPASAYWRLLAGSLFRFREILVGRQRSSMRLANVEIATDVGDRLAGHWPLARAKAGEQGVVGDDVDRARNSRRAFVNQCYSLPGKHLRRHSADTPDPAGNVRRCFLQRQRLQLAPERDPLLQLAK